MRWLVSITRPARLIEGLSLAGISLAVASLTAILPWGDPDSALAFRPLIVLSLGLALQGMAGRLRTHQARIEARRAERARIAGELHDTLIQSAHGLSLMLQALANELPPSSDLRKRWESLMDRSDILMNEARECMSGLRSSLPADGLLQSLAVAGRQLFAHTSTRFRLETEGLPRALAVNAQDQIYRIAREALNNAMKHAEARTVEVLVTYTSVKFVVRVRDDGCGFQSDRSGSRTPDARHGGLQTIGERARDLRSQVSIESRPGRGTELVVAVPAHIAYPKKSVRSRCVAALRPGRLRLRASGSLTLVHVETS